MKKYIEHYRKPTLVPREPLTRYCDIGEGLGVLQGQFHRARGIESGQFPAFRLDTGGHKWYAMSEVRAWWEKIGGKEFAVSPNAERNTMYRLRHLGVKKVSQSLLMQA
jgi:hypothetical protein